jgi:hypothetical protein
MNARMPLEEFDRQVQTLLRIGYPAIAGMSAETFASRLQPLKRLLEGAPSELPNEDGRVPFVIVVPREWVPLEEAMALTQLKDKTGYIDFRPGGLETFEPLSDLEVPEGHAYLVFDLDTGSDLRNLPPDVALAEIRSRRRTPLTLEEGLALLTHFPEKLKKNHCFSLAGSRSGDRRVPALWISQNRPRLGWCWAGNPHTWLGTASCGGRGAA